MKQYTFEAARSHLQATITYSGCVGENPECIMTPECARALAAGIRELEQQLAACQERSRRRHEEFVADYDGVVAQLAAEQAKNIPVACASTHAGDESDGPCDCAVDGYKMGIAAERAKVADEFDGLQANHDRLLTESFEKNERIAELERENNELKNSNMRMRSVMNTADPHKLHENFVLACEQMYRFKALLEARPLLQSYDAKTQQAFDAYDAVVDAAGVPRK